MVVVLQLESGSQYYDAIKNLEKAESSHRQEHSGETERLLREAQDAYTRAHTKYLEDRQASLQGHSQTQAAVKNLPPTEIRMIGDWQWAGYREGHRVTTIYRKKKELMDDLKILQTRKTGDSTYEVVKNAESAQT